MVRKFDQVKVGPIYLDELNSMPLNSQAKLLRALERTESVRLGGMIIAYIISRKFNLDKEGEIPMDHTLSAIWPHYAKGFATFEVITKCHS